MALDPSMLAAYQQEFSANWWHLAQQKDTKFAAFVDPASFAGESERFTRLSSQKFTKRTGRREKNKVTDPNMDFRHIFNDDYSLVNVLDKIDKRKIGNLTAPESEWVKSHAYGYNRLKDYVILNSALGNAISGEKPTDSTALGSGRLVAANSSGLTEAKVLAAKLLLDNGSHLSMEPTKRVLAVAPDDIVSVYNSVAATDIELRQQVRDIMSGKRNDLHGFELVQYTEWDTTLPGTTNSNRRVVGWIKGAVRFNEGGRESRITELDEQNFDLQVYSSAYVGGVRMEEALVVAIDCTLS